jgi:glycosyltransferase involved in cell wall biosynthesis
MNGVSIGEILTSRASGSKAAQISVVIPCLNEAENIEQCVREARQVLDESGIDGEVLVVDNGSDDGSGDLARAAGAIVIEEPRRGYGSAYLAGFAAATGDYVVMADADLTYDFREIPRFVRELEGGADLVMGNRMENIHPGAMPWLNRYVGNPLLSGFLNLLFHTKVRDVHCGMRAIRRDALPLLDLRATGMEFASEMVIRAARKGLDVREFPIELHPRGGESKLSPFRDGWRHLRLILVYSPNFLFVIPGALLVLFGSLIMLTVFARISLFGREWFGHTLTAGSLLVIVGTQVIGLGLCARTYGVYFMGERDSLFERMRGRVRLEHGLLVGGALMVAGLVAGGVIVAKWASQGFGTLGEERLAILSATLIVAGLQVVFTAFLLSILGLYRPRETPAALTSSEQASEVTAKR